MITVNKYKSNRLADYTKLLHNTCPFCGSEMLHTLRELPQIDRCSTCGQAFRQEMQRSTIDDYSRRPAMPSWLESHAAARHHFNFINNAIGFKVVENILEIGAGDGTLLKLIRRKYKNIDITAVEPSKHHCEILSPIPNVTVLEDYVEKIKFDRRFDLVIMSHVLEHLERPLETLRYIHDNLLTGSGFLYIDIPNQDYELQSRYAAGKAPNGHLYFFNGGNMADLLAKAGFAKYYFIGVKYKTLPSFYGKVLGWIAKLESKNANKHLINAFKAVNKLSIYASLVYRTFTGARPKEIPIDQADKRYNNIAIAVRK